MGTDVPPVAPVRPRWADAVILASLAHALFWVLAWTLPWMPLSLGEVSWFWKGLWAASATGSLLVMVPALLLAWKHGSRWKHGTGLWRGFSVLGLLHYVSMFLCFGTAWVAWSFPSSPWIQWMTGGNGAATGGSGVSLQLPFGSSPQSVTGFESDPMMALGESFGGATPLNLLAAVTVGTAVLMALLGLLQWRTLRPGTRWAVWLGLDVGALTGLGFMLSGGPTALNGSSRSTEATGLAWAPALGFWVLVRLILRAAPGVLRWMERRSFRVKVALRHLTARKSRFLTVIGWLSILAVVLSSCALAITLSVMGGFRMDLKQKMLGNHPHVLVQATGTNGTQGAGLVPMGQWARVVRQSRDVQGVVAATAFVQGKVMVTSATNLAGVELYGIDAAEFSSVVRLDEQMESGDLAWLDAPERIQAPRVPSGGTVVLRGGITRGSPGDAESPTHPKAVDPKAVDPRTVDRAKKDLGFKPAERPKGSLEVLPGIVIGRELAFSLRLHVGDELQIVTPRGTLGPQGMMPTRSTFRVAGVFYSGMYEYDMKNAYVQREEAARLMRMVGTVSAVGLRVSSLEQAPHVAQVMARDARFAGHRVRDWQGQNRNLFGALALERLAMFVVLALGVVVAGFCVFATLTLMVEEKGNQVGVLRAMGSSRRDILQIFLLEGLGVGVLGSLLGVGLGVGLCMVVQRAGLPLNPEVYYIDSFPIHFEPLELTMVALVSVLTTLVATMVPAHIASTRSPVDAVRYG